MAEEADAAKSTSMAIVPRQNRSGSPQDAVQSLAADIVFADRQPRPYIWHGSKLNGRQATPRHPEEEHHKVDLPGPNNDRITSNADNWAEVHKTRYGTRDDQRPQGRSSSSRYHNQDGNPNYMYQRSNSSRFSPFPSTSIVEDREGLRLLPSERYSAGPSPMRSPQSFQKENEYGDEVPLPRKSKMKAPPKRSATSCQIFDEDQKHDGGHRTILIEPEDWYYKRDTTVRYPQAPFFPKVPEYEEAEGYSDCERYFWEYARNLPRDGDDGRWVSAPMSRSSSLPRESWLCDTDIESWRNSVIKARTDSTQPTAMRTELFHGSHNHPLAGPNQANPRFNEYETVKLDPGLGGPSDPSTNRIQDKVQLNYSRQSLFGNGTSKEMKLPRANTDPLLGNQSKASQLTAQSPEHRTKKGKRNDDIGPERSRLTSTKAGPLTGLAKLMQSLEEAEQTRLADKATKARLTRVSPENQSNGFHYPCQALD